MKTRHCRHASCVLLSAALACAGGCSSSGLISLGSDNANSPPAGAKLACGAAACSTSTVISVTTNHVAQWIGPFVVDETGFYALVGDSVVRIAIDGSTTSTLASNQDKPRSIAIDDAYVYWTDTSALTNGAIMRAAKDGSSAPEPLASNQDHPLGIAVDDGAVYWTNEGTRTPADQDGNFTDPDGAVMKLAKDGMSAPAQLAVAQVPTGAIGVDASNVFWFQTGTGPTIGGSMMRIDKGGASPAQSILARPPGDVAQLALGGDNLFWVPAAQAIPANGPVAGGGPRLSAVGSAPSVSGDDGLATSAPTAMPKAGGSAESLAAGAALAVASDGTNVYWATAHSESNATVDGWLMKAPVGGGDPVAIAPVPFVLWVALDSTSVYFTQGGVKGETLVKVAK